MSSRPPSVLRRFVPSLLLLIPLAVSCSSTPDEPEGTSAEVAVRASLDDDVDAASVADAFGKTDRIRVRLRRNDDEELVLDRTFDFDPNREVTDVTVRVTITGRQQFDVTVSLSSGESELFQGETTVTLEPGRTSTAEVDLVPVPGGVVIRTEGPLLLGRSDSERAEADVVFATGDPIPDLPVDWISRNPDIVTTEPTGLILSQASPGETHVVARHSSFRDSLLVRVVGVLAFDALSAGSFHTCGIARERAYCWGWNQFGQLGNGTEVDATTPAAVSGDLAMAVLDLGFDHTCGVTSGGSPYCWGQNGSGQLGDGTTRTRFEPSPVIGGLSLDGVSAGNGHSCGRTSEGVAYCWGDNFTGQLGNGSTEGSDSPVPVAGNLVFSQVDASLGNFTCGIAGDGAAYCWGALPGQDGQSSTTPEAVGGGLSFSHLSAGGRHVCGLTSDGTAYCWGNNEAGQLGDGSNDASATPVAVSGGLDFTTLSAGDRHTCAVAEDGVLYCWGDNNDGQLGISEEGGSRTAPVAVAGEVSFTAVAAGEGHTCGLDRNEFAYCWGDNGNGQLGDGTRDTRLVPTRVSAPE